MHFHSYPGLYRGVIVDTNDPLGAGRVRMKVPQVMGEEVTSWAWPVLGGISQFKPVYGEWQADYTQSIASATVAYPVTYVTNDGASGITLQNSSQIRFTNPGVYNIQFSSQFQNTATSDHDVTMWIRKNGVDVQGSAGFVSIPSSHGGTPGHTLAAWNYVLEFAANDYFELMWQADSTAVTMEYYAPGTTPDTPSAASVILTVSAVGRVVPTPSSGVWAAFEGGDLNYPLWIGTF